MKSAGTAGQQSFYFSSLALPAAFRRATSSARALQVAAVTKPHSGLCTPRPGTPVPLACLWGRSKQSSHWPSSLHTVNLWEIPLFLKENLVIFHWRVPSAGQHLCPHSGSQGVEDNKPYPQTNSLSSLNGDTHQYIRNSLTFPYPSKVKL